MRSTLCALQNAVDSPVLAYAKTGIVTR